jgi:hypothetical protein
VSDFSDLEIADSIDWNTIAALGEIECLAILAKGEISLIFWVGRCMRRGVGEEVSYARQRDSNEKRRIDKNDAEWDEKKNSRSWVRSSGNIRMGRMKDSEKGKMRKKRLEGGEMASCCDALKWEGWDEQRRNGSVEKKSSEKEIGKHCSSREDGWGEIDHRTPLVTIERAIPQISCSIFDRSW